MEVEIIKRIRGFIRTQRYIGANEKLAVMRKRYSKAADEFYKEYGGIYYVNGCGESIGLNIRTTWHFITLEEKIASLQSQLKEERENFATWLIESGCITHLDKQSLLRNYSNKLKNNEN